MNYGIIGADTPIDDALAPYFPDRPNNLLYEIFESETNALLFALLMEQQGVDNVEDSDGSRAQTATYYSDAFTVGTGWSEINLDHVTESVDLRFDGPISVRFTSAGMENSEIRYFPDDSPVVGIPVETDIIALKRGESAEENVNVNLEAW